MEQNDDAPFGTGSRPSDQAPSGLDAPRFDPSRCRDIINRADQDTGDDEEDSYHIGVRDGFCEAVQLLDCLTGGDGEYRYCTDHNPERHCPGPEEMIVRLLLRLHPQPSSEDTP